MSPPPADGASQKRASLFSPGLARLSIALVLTTGLVAFESLSVVAALAQIGREFDSLTGLPWVVTSFLLASGLAVAVTGKLVDQLGSRSMFRSAAALFVVSSALCGLSQSMAVLILARALQGAASGAFLAVSGAAVGVGYPARLRSRVYAMNATVWGVLAFGGPALGGLLLATLGWRSIFLVNVPLAAFATWLGWSSFPPVPGPMVAQTPVSPAPPSPVPRPWLQPLRRAFDLRGFLLLGGAFLAAVLGLSAPLTWEDGALLGASVFLTWVYVRHSQRTESLMPWRFFGEPPYRHLAAAAGGAMAAGVAVENYLPLYLETARGVPVEWAAWSVLFLTLGWTSSANIVSRLYERISERAVILAGAAAMPPLLVVSFFLVRGDASLVPLLAAFFGLGFGIGSVTNASLTLVQLAAESNVVGRATSAHQFVRNVSVTLGTAAGGAALVTLGAETEAGPLAGEAGAGGAIGDLGGEVVRAAAIADGFAAAHLAALLFALLGLAGAWRLWSGPRVTAPEESHDPAA